MNELFPEIEPYNIAELRVSDLHTVVYEEVGNPNGSPALFLHGGPGVGILPGYRRFFDPEFYRVILLDQRGAGRSRPHAELEGNDTWEIVEDLEKLRKHLGIDRWTVMGGSWGSTLALCYAIEHPSSVAALIIRGIFLARPFEIDWLHKEGGTSAIFPDEWERYVEPSPADEREDIVGAYYRRITSDDDDVRREAAGAWTRWEAAIMNLIPDESEVQKLVESDVSISVGRIECHYTRNGFFMKSDNWILDNVDKIRHIPCRIVQGRYDVICPVEAAWDLSKALPGSDLRIVPDGSHSPLDAGMIHELVQASEDFKKTLPPTS